MSEKKNNEDNPIFVLASENQKQCHIFVEKLLKENPKLTYQDATNVWMFRQMAALEREIERLNRISRKNTPIR